MPLAEVSLDDGRPGTTRLAALAVEDPPAEVPVMIAGGASRGPLLIAAAGVHGDEFEGPLALWRVVRDLPPSSLHGCLVALPLCNPWATRAGTRNTPEAIDGLNLARTFPGDPQGAPTQRLAAALYGFVVALKPALFVDLHSGGVRYRFHPTVAYRHGLGDEARSKAAARAFGIPALCAANDHPGTFNSETARVGISTVGVEMTGAGGCLEEDVSANYNGVLNLLRFLGVLRDRAAPEVPGSFQTMANIFAPCPGYVFPLCAVGDQVQAGTVVAQILSPFGETVAEVTTPHSGEIWVMRHLRMVTAGEMVCAVSHGSEASEFDA